MDIYARPGTKVVYLGKNGYDHDREDVEKAGAWPGQVYTVADIRVGDWRSQVQLEELPGYHNTVMFQDETEWLAETMGVQVLVREEAYEILVAAITEAVAENPESGTAMRLAKALAQADAIKD